MVLREDDWVINFYFSTLQIATASVSNAICSSSFCFKIALIAGNCVTVLMTNDLWLWKTDCITKFLSCNWYPISPPFLFGMSLYQIRIFLAIISWRQYWKFYCMRINFYWNSLTLPRSTWKNQARERTSALKNLFAILKGFLFILILELHPSWNAIIMVLRKENEIFWENSLLSRVHFCLFPWTICWKRLK